MTFNEKVWTQCKKIPRGKVTTYKLLAESMGTRAYRAVGNALRRNPYAPAVPCHRVVASDLTLGGFMGSTGSETILEKKKMLENEGIAIIDNRIDESCIFDFQPP